MKQKKKSFRRKGKNNKKNKSKRNKRKNNIAIILYQKGGDGDVGEVVVFIIKGLWWLITEAGPVVIEAVKNMDRVLLKVLEIWITCY